MPESFEQFLSRLSREAVNYPPVEEATKQAIILPLLDHLGWNVYNVNEVVPEFSVEGGRVDYCLMVGPKKSAFLEVKRGIEELERHEK